MGLELVVQTPAQPCPPWPTLREALAQRGLPAQLRMIDGELAFHDEVPPDDWRELRLSLPAGMVTLARTPDTIRCIVWGNADAALQQQWRELAQTIAQLCGGTVAGVLPGESDPGC